MTPDSQSGMILVVDDDFEIRSLTKRFLEAAGWAVVTAADGAEGFRCYEERRADIVMLLTDIRMPNVNGFELADRVLEIDSELPVLFMSGEDWNAYPDLKCLAKPFGLAELLDSVSRTLRVNARSKTTSSAL